MPGPIRATNTRMSFILSRSRRAWLDAEAERIGVIPRLYQRLTASHCLRAALELFVRLPDDERTALVARYGLDGEEAGTAPAPDR